MSTSDADPQTIEHLRSSKPELAKLGQVGRPCLLADVFQLRTLGTQELHADVRSGRGLGRQGAHRRAAHGLVRLPFPPAHLPAPHSALADPRSGPSRTFGNPISIQVVAVVRLALGLRTLYTIPPSPALTAHSPPLPQTWALCHIADSAAGYAAVLRAAAEGGLADKGLYFEENGTFAWADMYKQVLQSLGLSTADVGKELPVAGEAELKRSAQVLGVEPDWVAFELAGR